MRLLAYGGTEYGERCRVGTWPSITTDPLEDTYGLSGGALAFGCGLQDNSLFLIIRQAQKQGQRLYAYSLLIEPDPEVWRAFQWNGAGLTLALFGGVDLGESAPDCLGRHLLERPEDFSEADLKSAFEILAAPRSIGTPASDEFLSLWVGALHSSDPVTVAPQSIGINARPTIAQVGSALQSLRPCFRAGLGWLVGGSAIHARTFGAHLVLDDWLTQEAPPVQEHIDNGRGIRLAWETLARHESYRQIMSEKLETPIWEWDELWRRSPAKSFDRVGCLAHVLNINSPDDDLVSAIQDTLDEQGPLEPEIRRAVHSLMVASHGPFNRTLTPFLLRDHFEKGLILDDGAAARLDTSTVIEFYTDDRRRIRPASGSSPLLPAEVRFEIWLRLISTEENPAELPDLLRGACSDLRSEESVRPRFGEIVLASLNRSLALTNSLEMWIAHRRDKILGSLIGEWLREESRRRVLVEAGHWQRVYVAFGEDSGGARLARLDIPAPSARTLVAEIARLSKSDDGLRQDARTWLSDLASSPLRLKIPASDKLELRDSLTAGWESFRAMLELYAGLNPAARAPANEQEALIGELKELTSLRLGDDFVPNLRGLMNFLGALPDDAISALASLHPRMKGNDVAGWMEGWEKLSPRDVYQDELVRQAMHSDKNLQMPALLNRLNVDAKRTELFRELFFGDSSLPDQRISDRCEKCIDYAKEDPTLAESIAVAFKDCEMDQSKRTIFFRRHCDQTRFLNRLFECLAEDERHLVLTIILSFDYNRLEGQACRYFTDSLKKISFDMNLYKQAVLCFVLSNEGKPLREAIVKHEELRNVLYVEKHLKTVLGSYAAREAQKLGSNKQDKRWKFWKLW